MKNTDPWMQVDLGQTFNSHVANMAQFYSRDQLEFVKSCTQSPYMREMWPDLDQFYQNDGANRKLSIIPQP